MEGSSSERSSTNVPVTMAYVLCGYRQSEDLHNYFLWLRSLAEEIILMVLWIPLAFLGCSPQGHCSTDKKTKLERRMVLWSVPGYVFCDSVSIPVDSDGCSLHCLPIFAAIEARLLLPGHEKRDGRVHIGLPT